MIACAPESDYVPSSRAVTRFRGFSRLLCLYSLPALNFLSILSILMPLNYLYY